VTTHAETVDLVTAQAMLEDQRAVEGRMPEHRRGLPGVGPAVFVPHAQQVQHPRGRGRLFQIGEVANGAVGQIGTPDRTNLNGKG
jgi:hypothetical protein